MMPLFMIGLLLILCCNSSAFCMHQQQASSGHQEAVIDVKPEQGEWQHCAICSASVIPEKSWLECLRDCMGKGKVTKCYGIDCVAVCHTACLKKYLKENRAFNRFKCARCRKGGFIVEEYGVFCGGEHCARMLGAGLFFTLIIFSVNYTAMFISSEIRWDDVPPCPECNESVSNMVCQFLMKP